MTEEVDVIIPFCGEFTPKRMLEEAKESVVSQSVPTNLIVVHDINQNGPAWARNRGIEQSSTRFVAFLDADDLWHENKLEQQLEALKNCDVGLCIGGSCKDTYCQLDADRFIKLLLFGDLESLTSSIVIDTEKTEPRFDEELHRFEDWLFMIEAAISGGVAICNGPLVTVRKQEQGLTANGSERQLYESRLALADYLENRYKKQEYANRLRQVAYISLALQFQYDGDYKKSVVECIRSLSYGFNYKSIGILMRTPYFLLRDQFT